MMTTIATPLASFTFPNITRSLYSTITSTGKIRLGYFEERDEFIANSDNPLSHIDNPTLQKLRDMKGKILAIASILDILDTQFIISDIFGAQTNRNRINLLA